MKKTLFALFAVLLVLSLAACNFYEMPPDARGGLPNPPENGMVRLAINVGGGSTNRALTLPLAQADADYYEVVFKSGSLLYQAGFASGGGSITIPTGYYDTAEKAVMFAGKKIGSDYTLLGVGIIDTVADIDLSTATDGLIKPTTVSVTFKLTALRNDVNFDPDSSTFKITGPVSGLPSGLVSAGNYVTARGPGTILTATDPIPPVNYPKFPIPPAGYVNPGTTTGDIAAEYSVTIPHNTAVILQANWDATAASITLGSDSGITETVTLTETTKTVGSAIVSGASPATCKFAFKIDVSALTPVTGNGLCAVSIDAPVCAISNTASFASGARIIWHIRGGTVNSDPDAGISPGSTGGAVILAIGP